MRERAENVIVIAEDGGGMWASAKAAHAPTSLARPPHQLRTPSRAGGPQGIEDIGNRTRSSAGWRCRRHDIDANPSAFAAIELALLDLFARQAGVSLERLLGIAEPGMELRTSAVYGTGRAKFLAQTALFQLNGMRDAKLKVSGRLGPDRRRRGLLRCSGRSGSMPTICGRRPKMLSAGWRVWRDTPGRWRSRSCPRLGGPGRGWRQTGLAIILDESVTRIEDLAQLMAGATYVLNARVSKLGGLLRTLAIIGEAHAKHQSSSAPRSARRASSRGPVWSPRKRQARPGRL